MSSGLDDFPCPTISLDGFLRFCLRMVVEAPKSTLDSRFLRGKDWFL